MGLTIKGKRKQKNQLKGGLESVRNGASTRPPSKRINPYAACVAQFGHNGKVHLYLNAGIPDGHHPSEGICPKCGHAYSHMIGSGRDQCDECDGDDIAMRAKRLEDAGINLGWGFGEQSRDYTREAYRMSGVGNLPQKNVEV